MLDRKDIKIGQLLHHTLSHTVWKVTNTGVPHKEERKGIFIKYTFENPEVRYTPGVELPIAYFLNDWEIYEEPEEPIKSRLNLIDIGD
jgi:hypothetical protein